MKSQHLKYVIAAAAILAGILFLIVGCSSPPTKFETRLFDVQTNRFPIIELKTNVIQITVFNTNMVYTTNSPEKVTAQPTVATTNIWQTNVVWITNGFEEAYSYRPGARAREVQETAGAVGNLFGVGGIVTTGIGALLALWAQMRSSRRYTTAATLAQTIETLRVFMRSLPNGTAYDTAFVQWMQSQQMNAGVVQQVVDLLQREVSNPDAKEAAREVSEIITALQGLPNPPTPLKV